MVAWSMLAVEMLNMDMKVLVADAQRYSPKKVESWDDFPRVSPSGGCAEEGVWQDCSFCERSLSNDPWQLRPARSFVVGLSENRYPTHGNLNEEMLLEFRHQILRYPMFRPRQSQRSLRLEVMNANLLLFKTVVALDSWGKVAIPLIERNPFAALIFCGCPAARRSNESNDARL